MVFVGAKVKMRLLWSRVTLNLKTGVLVRQSRGRLVRGEERLVRAGAEVSVSGHKPGDSWGLQLLGEAAGAPQSLQRVLALI